MHRVNCLLSGRRPEPPRNRSVRFLTAAAALCVGWAGGLPSVYATHGGPHEFVLVELAVTQLCDGGRVGTTVTLGWTPGSPALTLRETRPDGTTEALGDFSGAATLTRTEPGQWAYTIFSQFAEPNGNTTTYQSQAVAVQVPALGASACAPPNDTDGDLIPDPWEASWGLNASYPFDADQDPDADLLSNRDEWFALTNPTAYTPVASLSERQLLDLFAGKAFLYLWEQSRPPYHFTPDKANYNDPADYSQNFNSIATTGFSLLSYVIADDREWIGHQAAYERVRTLLARAVALQAPSYDQLGVPANQQGNRHGYLYHFVDDQGFRHSGSEISTIDHALFAAGALVAGEYYKGTEVEQLAQQLALNTDWNWLYNGTFLYQGWIEDPNGTLDGGRTLDLWNRYSELMILLFLAMGHSDPSNAIPASAWDHLTYGTSRMFPYEYAHLVPGDAPQNFAFVPNMPNTITEPGYTNSATEFHYLHAGSLHNHQYSHLFADYRARRDRYNTDFFANSIGATMANRQYCISLNSHLFGGDPTSFDPYLRQPYETYWANSWGIMAGVPSYTGYAVLQPIVMSWDDFSPNNIALNNDSGSVILSASLGSTPFTPRQTVDMVRYVLDRFQANQSGFDALVGRYGFRNAYNLGRTYTGQLGHFPTEIIGLDMGPVVGSVENFNTGLVWKMAMRNSVVQRGMEAAGFNTGNVEPFIINFDSNPPAPHEDPNGGGLDPNSFGGFSGGWDSGSVVYENIGDPRPDIPYGPQDWAQRIMVTDGSPSGAFITLNHHSVSHWDRVSFWIRGAAGGESFLLGLKDRAVDRLGSPLEQTEVKVPIAAYHPAGQMTTDWTEVRVPLRVFAEGGVRLPEMDNLSFTNAGPFGGAIYVDDIAFLGDEFNPQSPQGLSAVANGLSVTLTWQANAEPDVVGYRVYRSTDGGATYALQTPLLVVPTTYTDTAVLYGRYDYYITAVDNASPANESSPSASVFAKVNVPPTVSIIIDPPTVTAGQPFTIIVSGTSPVGLAAVWWWGENTGVTDATVTITYPTSPTSNQTFTTPVVNPTKLDRAFGSPLFSAAQQVTSYSFTSTVVIPTPGTYQFGANARDVLYPVPFEAHQASEGAGIQIVAVQNQPPQANAGADQTVFSKDTVSLAGTGSDPEGDQLTYVWVQTAGPTVTLADPTSPATTFEAPRVFSPVVVTLTLQVSDGRSTAQDALNVTINPANRHRRSKR